jgi:hypothetical protein
MTLIIALLLLAQTPYFTPLGITFVAFAWFAHLIHHSK